MGCQGSKGDAEAKGGKYLLETVTGHTDSINCMALSEDESVLVTGDDREARLWDVDGGQGGPTEEMGTLKGHTSYVTSVDVSGVYVVTGSSDCTVKKWDMTTCECCFTYEGHKGKVMRVICTGDYIISSSIDKTAKVWIFDTSDITPEAKQRCCVRTFEVYYGHNSPIICMSVVNQLMYTGDTGGKAKSWVWRYGDSTCEYKGHNNTVTCLKFHQGILYTGCGDGLIRAFDAKTGVLRQTFRREQSEGAGAGVVNCLTVCGNKLYSGSHDGMLRVWDVSSWVNGGKNGKEKAT